MPPASPTLLDELLRIIPELEEVARGLASSRPSQPRYDDHADQAVELAKRIYRAARGPGRTLSLSR